FYHFIQRYQLSLKSCGDNRGIVSGNEAPEYGEFEKKHRRQLPDLRRTHFLGSKLGDEHLWRIKEDIYQSLRSETLSRLQPVYLTARDQVLFNFKYLSLLTFIQAKRENTNMPHLVLIPTLPNTADPNSDIYAFQFI